MDDLPFFALQGKACVSCKRKKKDDLPVVASRRQYAGVEGGPVVVVVIGLGCDWEWLNLPSLLGEAGSGVVVTSVSQSGHVKGKSILCQ